MPGADPAQVSDRAATRGAPQLGSLGGGNHFLEVQVVDQVRDAAAAAAMGLETGQVCVMLHTGSRGIGHQTCTDHLKVIDRLAPALGIRVPDRQLSCLPVERPEGGRLPGGDARRRQLRPGQPARARRRARRAFAEVLGRPVADLGMDLVYDVSHNLAKLEEHEVDGRRRTLCVHRKGATRALGPGHPELPGRYREVGQPVINPAAWARSPTCWPATGGPRRACSPPTCHGAGGR